MSLAPNLLVTYHNLMDNINYGLIIVDNNLNVCMTNKWLKEHCRHLINEDTNEYLYHLFPEIKNTRISDAIDSTFEFGYPAIISNIFTPTPFPLYELKKFDEALKNDSRIQQQITIARLEAQGEFYCLIQISDVSAAVSRERMLEQEVRDRKEIENALLESDIKHTTIMEKMIDGLIVFNEVGAIESFNPACETLFGYSESAVLGLSITKLFQGLQASETTTGKSELLLNANFIGSYQDILAIRIDKQTFDVELSISEMNVGEKKFYTAIIRDITERKNIDKMKSEFISTVSHELRTPLTSIRGSLGLINGGAIDHGSSRALDLIKIAYDNCDRLVLLINDILDMEKFASGEMQFDIQRCNLTPLLFRSIKDNQAYADHYNVNFKFSEEKAYEAYLDPHRLLQVMANLLSNAAKFSAEDGIVNIHISESNQNIIVAVQDFGEGIPDEYQHNIWRKFTQADASTTRKKGGTGLGLAISRSLVEAMQGSIRFESQQNVGTTFFITFPAAP